MEWRGGKYQQPALMDAISRKKSTGLLSRNRKEISRLAPEHRWEVNLYFLVTFSTLSFYCFWRNTEKRARGFIWFFLFWCTFSVCKVVPLLSKVYLKRNPFNYRAQIAAVFLPYLFLRHHQATGFLFVILWDTLNSRDDEQNVSIKSEN